MICIIDRRVVLFFVVIWKIGLESPFCQFETECLFLLFS